MSAATQFPNLDVASVEWARAPFRRQRCTIGTIGSVRGHFERLAPLHRHMHHISPRLSWRSAPPHRLAKSP